MNRVKFMVDGMTASGKTTIVNIISEEFNLDIMKEDFRDKYNLLERFSEDQKKWGFPMQLNFLVNRFVQFKVASEAANYVMDRCIFSDKVYAKMYYQENYLTSKEYKIYEDLYEELIKEIVFPKYCVFLTCSFETILKRIWDRGRTDEHRLGKEYWNNLYHHYTKYIEDLTKRIENENTDSRCFIINTENLDPANKPEDRKKIIESLNPSRETI